MKKLLLLAIVVGGVLACSTTRKAGQAVSSPVFRETREGVVRGISTNEIAVYSRGISPAPTIWVRRTPSTELSMNGEPFNWDTLQEGTPVRVFYQPEAGAEQLLKLEVLTGSEAAKVKAEAGEPSTPTTP
jgi:hypothetical protein